MKSGSRGAGGGGGADGKRNNQSVISRLGGGGVGGCECLGCVSVCSVRVGGWEDNAWRRALCQRRPASGSGRRRRPPCLYLAATLSSRPWLPICCSQLKSLAHKRAAFSFECDFVTAGNVPAFKLPGFSSTLAALPRWCVHRLIFTAVFYSIFFGVAAMKFLSTWHSGNSSPPLPPAWTTIFDLQPWWNNKQRRNSRKENRSGGDSLPFTLHINSVERKHLLRAPDFIGLELSHLIKLSVME